MKKYSSSDFKVMPWKNGGGETLEIFSLRDSQGEILFRLSSATITQDGPFSYFPQIERILFLLSGKGFKLSFTDKEILLNNPLQSIHFQGEESINCELVNGPCTDFNIMTNRNFAQSSFEIKKIKPNDLLTSSEGRLFIYLNEVKELYEIELHESYQHQGLEQTAFIINMRPI